MIEIDHHHYSIEELARIAGSRESIKLSQDLEDRITKGRTFLEEFIQKSTRPIYGINTGFGSLCNTIIQENDLSTLQENLVRSHACGVGEVVDPEIVRYMLLLKVLGLSKGHSGVKLETVQGLINLYNHDLIPVVYEQGSLGASGDLAPLAHLSLPLIGEGEVYYHGDRVPSSVALEKEGLGSIALGAKEGLALLNGTQFMSGYATHMLAELNKQFSHLDKISALSLDAFDGRIEPFDDAVHVVRPHNGQRNTARIMREMLAGSEWMERPKAHVQDPYSFRCIPQVHGASRDAIAHVTQVVETEINAVTDNPTLVPDEDKIISAGNFHGQPLALTMDYLAIAMAELASISERRCYKLISGERRLPEYLVKNPGLNSGLMIAQYTAASIVSQNKQLCTPASVDTIDSSNGQEDHVSMGANAATKGLRVFHNLRKVNAIELMLAAQAAEFREGHTSVVLTSYMESYREHVPMIEEDRNISELIHKTIAFIS